MVKKFYLPSIILLWFGFFVACNQKEENTKSSTSDSLKTNSQKSMLLTKPIDTALARKCVDAFFSNIKPANPQMKCFVEIDQLETLIADLNKVGATGIRIYSAGYTKEAVEQSGMNVSENDYHLILVPIKDGEDILTDGKNSTVYNFNNDCPQYCNNIEKAKLLWEGHRVKCK